MNQKKMKITFRTPGEVNNGDIIQCPYCRKKFVVIPGLIQYRLDGKTYVICSQCGVGTSEEYYAVLSTEGAVELPPKQRRRGGGQRA